MQWSGTIKALEDPGAPLGRLWITLNIVKVKLEPKEGLQKVISKLKWPFDEKEIEKIISTIEREKDLLHLALTNDCRYVESSLNQHNIRRQRQHLQQPIFLSQLHVGPRLSIKINNVCTYFRRKCTN
jgi:hypothetical protein